MKKIYKFVCGDKTEEKLTVAAKNLQNLIEEIVLGNDVVQLKLSPEVHEVNHYVNDSHIVMCDGLNTTRVRWLNPKGNVIEDKKGRVHVEEMKNGIIALVFELISLSDKDNWTCQAETGDHKKSFKMIVYQPISFMDTPIVQTARENSDATIRCEVKGDPEPSISWYYNGQMINLPNQKYSKLADGLLIKKVQRNDSGEYTCKAFQVSATISNVKEQTIRLKIQHKPLSLTKKATADIAYGYLYGIVNLTCEAEAEPAANFTWLRNHKQLNPNNNKIYIGEHISVLQLLINDSKKFGEYKCKAQNMYGTFERTITLNQGVKPNKPTKLELRGLNSDRFDIDVGAARTTSERTDMDINGYRFELIPLDELKANGGKWDRARVILVGFEDGITYLINDLTPNTTYYVRVAARNPAGLSDWQGPKEFRTNPANLMVRNTASILNPISLVMYYVNFLIIFNVLNKINNNNLINLCT